jgi:hypothetical protein
LKVEKLINPYFRVHLPLLKERVVALGLLDSQGSGGGDNDVETPINVMRVIRLAKDFNVHLKQTAKKDTSKE